MATRTGSSRRKRGGTLARLAWWIHGLAGLKLSLVMTFVVITGTLAVFGHEWDWLFGSYQSVAPKGAPADLPQIYDAIRQVYPDHAIVEVTAPRGPRSAASAIAVSPQRQYRRIYVDPYRPARVVDTDMLSAQALLRQIHMRLLLPKYGRTFVSALGFLIVVSLVSGLLAYKRFWRGFLRKPRRRDLRTFLGDCHRLCAVWSIWFLALMAVTGLWYLYESVDTYGAHLDVPSLPDAAGEGSARDTGTIPMAEAIAAARTTVPGLRVRRLEPPGWGRDAIVVQGHDGAWLVRPRATAVAVDPYSGAVTHVRRASRLGWKARLHEAVDPLHFGTFGGFASQLVWFVFGLAMSFLTVSGLVIHARRLARGRAGAPRRGTRSAGRPAEDVRWGDGAT